MTVIIAIYKVFTVSPLDTICENKILPITKTR